MDRDFIVEELQVLGSSSQKAFKRYGLNPQNNKGRHHIHKEKKKQEILKQKQGVLNQEQQEFEGPSLGDARGLECGGDEHKDSAHWLEDKDVMGRGKNKTTTTTTKTQC